MSENNMGLFGHVPTADEINAKAFVLDRRAQPHGWWPGYIAGLSDAGAVDDAQAQQLLFAALNGQFAHNLESLFYGELEGDEEELEGDEDE